MPELAQLVPWLDAATAVRIEGGWTSETYELAGRWIVQIARTSYATNTLRHQLRILPRLAPHFGSKIPRPQLACDGPVTVVYKKLDGTPADPATPGAWPAQLGGFLDRLHSMEPKAAGCETLESATLRDDLRIDCRRRFAVLGPMLTDTERFKAELLLADLLDDDRMWKFYPVVAHGDLGPEHVLVSPSGDLAGVIDWEEVGCHDPALDFAWWLNAHVEIGERMLAAYTQRLDDKFRERARCLYAIMPWDEVERGVATADHDLIESGLAGARARL